MSKFWDVMAGFFWVFLYFMGAVVVLHFVAKYW